MTQDITPQRTRRHELIEEHTEKLDDVLLSIQMVADGTSARIRELKGCEIDPHQNIVVLDLLSQQASYAQQELRKAMSMVKELTANINT